MENTKIIFYSNCRYAGEVDRNKATAILENKKNGTFLVRFRPNAHEEDKFALSLKYDRYR